MTRVAGLPIAERVLRHAMRQGVSRVVAWAPRSADDLRSIASRIGSGLPPLVIATTEAEWMEAVNTDHRPGSSFRVVGPGSIPKPALSIQRLQDVPVAELAIRQSIFKPTDGVLAVRRPDVDPGLLARWAAGPDRERHWDHRLAEL